MWWRRHSCLRHHGLFGVIFYILLTCRIIHHHWQIFRSVKFWFDGAKSRFRTPDPAAFAVLQNAGVKSGWSRNRRDHRRTHFSWGAVARQRRSQRVNQAVGNPVPPSWITAQDLRHLPRTLRNNCASIPEIWDSALKHSIYVDSCFSYDNALFCKSRTCEQPWSHPHQRTCDMTSCQHGCLHVHGRYADFIHDWQVSEQLFWGWWHDNCFLKSVSKVGRWK